MSDESGGPARRNRVAAGVLAGVAAVLAVCVCLALRPQPQMGTSDAAFHTVDALYTAVREQNPRLVDGCEARLKAYRAAGTLPPAAADRLDAVIATARSGAWQAAAERLHDFMAGQRREGAIERDRPPAAKKVPPR